LPIDGVLANPGSTSGAYHSKYEKVQHEKFELLYQPGLVQLDGARYHVEVRSGLVKSSVSLLGPEDERQNQQSPLLTWMAYQKSRFQ